MKYNVVIQTAFIGDLFLSIPTLQKIRSLYPDQKIALICKKGLKGFFIQTGLVDEAYEVVKGDSKSYKSALQFCNQLSVSNVFCLHRSFRSALLAFQIKAQKRYGYTSWFASFVFSKHRGYIKKWPDAVRQISLLTLVDSDLSKKIDEKDWQYLNIKNNQAGFDRIPELFDFKIFEKKNNVDNKKIVIFPGSVWATKKWTPQGFAYVAGNLINQGYKVFVLGGPDDQKDAQALFEAEPRVANLTGKMSLTDSSLFLRDAALVICNDSAPAHIAAALRRPVLAIFGPTVLEFGFRPWNDQSKVMEIDLECRPCGAHGHHKCPLGHHKCMVDIDKQKVLKVVQEMLSEY